MLFDLNMAAGNVRGAMRPQGRSPSFFIVGLFLAVAILGFNYWSLSKRNKDLAAQLLNMQDQLRLCISKRMTVERRGSTIVSELKKCETALDMDKNEVARKESEVISLTEQLKNKEFQINSYETKLKEMEELRMSLKTCEENNIGITQELQKKKDMVMSSDTKQGLASKLEELRANQANGVNADTCKLCKDQWVFDQKAFLNGIDNVLGPTALLQLKNAGVDIGNYALEISAQLKNSQSLKYNEAQQNPLVNNMSVVPRSVDNLEIRKIGDPSNAGQNVGADKNNNIVVNPPVDNGNNVGDAGNPGAVVPPANNNIGDAGNPGAVVLPANNTSDAGNPGAGVPPANNNVGDVGNPGAVVLPANNNVGDVGNPGAVVPPANNNVGDVGNPGAIVPPTNNNVVEAGNPGAIVPPANNNDGDAGNPGAVVPPANNNVVEAGNPGAIVPPANNNDGDAGNPGAIVPPANNNDGDAGNPAAVVPPINNNDIPIAGIQAVVAGETKNSPQNNNDAVIGNPAAVAPLLNNNNEGGGGTNSLNPGNAAVAEKLKAMDVAENNHNFAQIKPRDSVFWDTYGNKPKIENNSLLDLLRSNKILSENQLNNAPDPNDSKLLAVQDGVEALTKPQTGSNINITEIGSEKTNLSSTNKTFGINTSNAEQTKPVSSANMVNSSVLVVNNTKTDSFNTGQESAHWKPSTNSETIKYLQTKLGPNSNVKEDNLKGGLNTQEDGLETMQKNMVQEEKNH